MSEPPIAWYGNALIEEMLEQAVWVAAFDKRFLAHAALPPTRKVRDGQVLTA